jgi:hypothetical protein
MSQEKLSNEIFNELMAQAFELKRKFPKADDSDIATLVCTSHKEHEDYDIILFQVIINLVNANRA